MGPYTAGIAAPILLTIMRLLQGLAMVRARAGGRRAGAARPAAARAAAAPCLTPARPSPPSSLPPSLPAPLPPVDTPDRAASLAPPSSTSPSWPRCTAAAASWPPCSRAVSGAQGGSARPGGKRQLVPCLHACLAPRVWADASLCAPAPPPAAVNIGMVLATVMVSE